MKKSYTAPKMKEIDWRQVDIAELTYTSWSMITDVKARAQVCYDDRSIYVRMEAKERAICARLTGQLAPVYEDSCLEFFFAPLKKDRRYFNFEWNPLGTLYLGFGAERTTRVRQIVENKEKLFAPKPFRTEEGWGITFEIPVSFVQLYMPEFKTPGKSSCNFYKCGDKTETPHYLAWAPITDGVRDYHRRQDFGEIYFV